MTTNTAYSFFIGWGIILAFFYGGTKFEGTRTLIYYILWLTIVLGIVANYQTLQGLIQSAVPPPVQSDTSVNANNG